MRQYNKWTAEEDEILLKAISDSSDHLQQAFLAASYLVAHTPKACQNRWYTHLRHTNKGTKTFVCMTVSKGKPNNLPVQKTKPHTIMWHIKYLWNCVLSLFYL